VIGRKAFLPKFAGFTILASLLICAMTVDSLSSQACTKSYTLRSPEDRRITGLYYGQESDWDKNLITQAIEPRKWQQVTIASNGDGYLLIKLGEETTLKGKAPNLCRGLSRIIVYKDRYSGEYLVNFE
jgi:hypothetical protein